MSLRVLVVDDERPARRKILAHLAAEEDVDVVGEAGDGFEAVGAIREHQPDLVFLDVQMPGLDGFEVVEAVGVDAMPAIVFVTAFDEYALRAFEVEAVDYLLKPFDAPRFQRAFRRARQHVESAAGPGGPEPISRVLAAVQQARGPLLRLVVSDRGRVVLVPVDELTHLSAEGNYVRAHTRKGSHLIRDTLARLEARLDADRFARIHRSEIVAIDAIQELQAASHGDYVVLMKNGERLRLSRRYQGRLLGAASEG